MTKRVRLLSESSLSSKTRVRGRPFEHGNPGRPPGSKNKTTRLLENLVEGDAEELGKKMTELAKQGNVRCLEFCLDHLMPKRRGRTVDLQLPKINGAQDIVTAMGVITDGLGNGSITPEEASQLVQLLDSYRSALIANDFAVRLEKVESAVELQGRKRDQ